ncbi:PQQ-dependent sugar dehydrogenase, partial [Candidatus Pelagibacter sp.]|nr:PQQ-dependent sugar dehydrogenase [Candidatus Pelagibacter sp.]
IKKVLKNSFFYFSNLKRKNTIITKAYDKLNKNNQVLYSKLIELQQSKDIVNEEIFPQTQFIKLNYKSFKLKDIESRALYYGTDKKAFPFYLEYYKDDIIVSSKQGSFFQVSIENLLNDKLNQIEITTNLPSKIEITDTKIINDKIYVVFHDKNKDCKNINIYFAKVDLEKLNFEKFYDYSKGQGTCDNNSYAGRIEHHSFNNKDGIFLSTISFDDINVKIKDQFGNKNESKFSDIVFIGFDDRKLQKYATGFRNPQGLVVVEDNYLLSSEHGPRGGDEINLVEYNKNYGWPYVSYGENYFKSYNENEPYDFIKSSKEFEEPIFSFVPSIAPSQIITVDSNFSEKWGDAVLLSTLRGQSLYLLKFSSNYKRLIFFEKIRLKKRIRDLIYVANHELILLAEESEGTIGVISNSIK